ncbi:MAG: PAS domain S-box protein [Proteobacteria bacterium]|nr:PAS domain S-box protein [Pseudomonadota bacterium]
MILLNLIQNIALLVGLIVAHQFIVRRLRRRALPSQVLSGLLFGGVGIVGMMTPVHFAPGIIFDGRSIILGVSGLFGGPLTAAIAAAMCGAYRLWLGGAGAWVGTAIVLEAAVLGVTFHFLRRYNEHIVKPWPLLGFGVLVHIVMLATLLALPDGAGLEAIHRIGPTVLLVYPPATLLVCLVFLDREERLDNERVLQESEEKYRLLVDHAGEAICVAQDGRVKFANAKTGELIGYKRDELIGASFIEFIHPDDRALVMDRHVKRLRGEDLPFSYTFRVVHRSGQTRSVEMKVVLVEWEGRPASLNFLSDMTERVRAEEALRQSEALLKATQRLARVGGWEWDARAQSVYWTDEVYRIHGFSPDEFDPGSREHLDRGFQCYDPEDRPVIETAFNACVREGRPFDLEFPLTTGRGRRIWIRTMARPEIENGEIVKVLGNIMDITESKQADETLRRAEARLRKAEIVSRSGYWEFDLDQDRVEASEGARIIYGLGETEWNIASTQQIPLPEYRAPLDEAMRGLIERGEPYDIEFRIRKPDTGEIADIHSIAEHDREKNRVFGIIQDVSHHKRTEHALRESEQRFRSLVEGAPDAIFVQTDHRFVYLNQAALAFFGAESKEQLVGQPVMERFHPDYLEKIEERSRMLHERGEAVPGVEEVCLRLDGTEVPAEVSAMPIHYDGKDGALVFLRDITERKKLEEQLRQAQKMESVGTLAGGVAHDFNNLLQAINGYTQLLLIGKKPDSPDRPKLMEIEKACGRAAQLVRQLLLFSRKVEADRRPVDLNEEVEQALRLLEHTIPKMVAIEFHPGDGLWTIQADPVQIEQTLLNLGGNAADAMPDGGRLVVETQNTVLDEEYARGHLGAGSGNYVLLTVSDTGAGMDKATQAKIFDPFFTTKEFGKGTGLGLASVYGIVKGHGGYISCYSEIGRGTTFKIYIPSIEQGQESPVDQESEEPPRGGTETILIVDDEAAIRDFASQALRSFGYAVMTASNGEEALQLHAASRDRIDLVILDIGMPVMGGHRCLQEIRRSDPSARVLMASGYSINGHAKQALESGALGFISKPYRLLDLLARVRRALDAASTIP